ncbi:MAG: hypothetical protein AAFV33_05340, partial [Chloroflexota bacterium]
MHEQHTGIKRWWILLYVIGLMPVVVTANYTLRLTYKGPGVEEWYDDVPIAVRAAEGRLSLEDVMMESRGHRIATHRAVIALSTVVTRWNVPATTFLIVVVAAVNVLLVVDLVRRLHPGVAAFCFLPLTLLVFIIYHHSNWVDGYYLTWQLANLFFLLGLYSVMTMKHGGVAMVVAAVCVLLATFSIGSGIAAWAGIAVVLASRPRYQNWRVAISWLMAGMASGLLFISDYARNPNRVGTDFTTLLTLDNLHQRVTFPINLQTMRFIVEVSGIDRVIILVAILLTVINLVMLYRTMKPRQPLAVWGALLVYGLASGAIISLARLASVAGADFYRIPVHYSPATDTFWMGFVIINLVLVSAMWPRRVPGRVLAVLNVVILCAVCILGARKTLWSYQVSNDMARFETTNGEFLYDACLEQYPLQRSPCLDAYGVPEESLYQLAIAGLTLYADLPRVTVIPPEETDPVVVHTPHRWLAAFIVQYLLAGTTPDAVAVIAPEAGAWAEPSQFIREEAFYERDAMPPVLLPLA